MSIKTLYQRYFLAPEYIFCQKTKKAQAFTHLKRRTGCPHTAGSWKMRQTCFMLAYIFWFYERNGRVGRCLACSAAVWSLSELSNVFLAVYKHVIAESACSHYHLISLPISHFSIVIWKWGEVGCDCIPPLGRCTVWVHVFWRERGFFCMHWWNCAFWGPRLPTCILESSHLCFCLHLFEGLCLNARCCCCCLTCPSECVSYWGLWWPQSVWEGRNRRRRLIPSFK